VPNPGDEQYQTQEMNTKITINTSVSGNNLNLVSNKGIFFLYAIFESLFPMTDAEILLARVSSKDSTPSSISFFFSSLWFVFKVLQSSLPTLLFSLTCFFIAFLTCQNSLLDNS
jgi:hypothetical protein